MKFNRQRDPRVRGHRVAHGTASAASGLPTQSEIRVNLNNTMLGWKVAAMVRGDVDNIDELAMLWSLNRLMSEGN